MTSFRIEFQTEEEAKENERSPSVALLCAGLLRRGMEYEKERVYTIIYTMYIFYRIKAFLKLLFAVSFSDLFITIQYAVFRKSLRTFYARISIYIYIW